MLVLAAVIVAILAVGALGAWYLFLRPSGPAAIGSAPPVVPSDAPVAVLGSTDGTWTIDSSIGSFDDFSGSWVGYQVQEQLVGIGGATAVGRTPDVTGTLTIDGTTVTQAEITADLTTLQSDERMRDGQLARQGIESARYPTATFTLVEPIELDALPADGQTVEVAGVGDLTLHGVTNRVSIPLKATLTGDVIAINGTLPFTWQEWGMTRPESMRVLSVADGGLIELQLFLRHD
jgi:polyisoprenoid-binding protein YceI